MTHGTRWEGGKLQNFEGRRGGVRIALVFCLVLAAVAAPISIPPAHGDPPAGTVWAWGGNYNGELGDGTTTDRHTPVQVSGITGATAVAAGWGSAYALNGDGTVSAWGYNTSGQLGDGTTFERHTPVQVLGLGGVTAIAAGDTSAYALKGDGTVWAWGQNAAGALGDGTTTDRHTPVQVSTLSGVTAVAAGWGSAYALKTDGTVWAWGFNYYGELGDGTTVDQHAPVQVSGLSGVTSITASAGTSAYALKGDGTVWAWGSNNYGALGDGTTVDQHAPVQVSGLSGATAIGAGSSSGYALRSDGTVWAWGNNGSGELGDGTTTVRLTPVQVSGLSGATSIAASAHAGFASKADGTAWAWGAGPIGDGATTARLTPVKVFGLSGVTALAGGDWSSAYAVASSGPPVGDQVFFSVIRGLSYSNSQTLTSGDIAIGRDGNGIKYVSGAGTFPSSVSGNAQVGINVSRFWILPFYTGTVRLTDAAAGIAIVHPLLFSKVDSVADDGATNIQGWVDLSHYPWKPYTLIWTVRDLA